MRKILILLMCVLLFSFNSYAEGENYSLELESEKATDKNVFNNDVKIIYMDDVIESPVSEVTENKCVINKDSKLLYAPSADAHLMDIPRGTEVIVVEQHDDFSKIMVNGEYKYISTSDLGTEEELKVIEEKEYYPFHESIPLNEDLQKYIYDKCVEHGIKYCLFLGLCQQETDFGRYAKVDGIQFHNVSKTNDWGMCQTNKKWVWPDVKKVFGWDNIEILFNPYRSVDAGIWEFSKCVRKYGNTEAAYDAYNRGLEYHGSTMNSRAVVYYWNQWKSILGDI